MDKRERYEEARKHVTEIKAFYTRLFTLIIANVVLFAIDYLSKDDSWFFWPLGFSVIFLILDWFFVFKGHTVFTSKWESRKIKQIMQQLDEHEDPTFDAMYQRTKTTASEKDSNTT